MLHSSALSILDRLKSAKRERPSLSTYFPKGTQFFYGYPSGDAKDFLNLVPPAVEEMVAARVVCCAGEGVVPVCFHATTSSAIDLKLLKYLGVPIEPESTIVIPASIDPGLVGQERNQAIKHELLGLVKPNAFVMAQPYQDADFADYYQIHPSITAYFNDKHHMPEYIDPLWLPERRHAYDSGAEFAAANDPIALPAVIKVSASSSGDGVSICKTDKDLEEAKRRFKTTKGRVIVEQHIDYLKSYGVHFGIPADPLKPADLIGINEQITTIHGEFLGGIIEHVKVPESLERAVEHLMNTIIPRVRARGWHGIGGFDVLVDADGQAYFIDANFRMTGMSAYHFLIDSGVIHRPIMSVLGEFHGTEDQLRVALGPHLAVGSQNRFLKLICLSRHGDVWRFNGALEYTSEADLAHKVNLLLDAGVDSGVLSMVSASLATAK